MILSHLIQCSAMQVEDPMQTFWWISHKHYQWPYIHSKTQIQVYNCVHRLNWNAFMTSRDPAFFYKIIMIQFGFNSSEIESIYFLPPGIWTSASCIPPKPRWCRSQQANSWVSKETEYLIKTFVFTSISLLHGEVWSLFKFPLKLASSKSKRYILSWIILELD